MNAVARIVLGLGALALASGCAVATAPDEDEGTSTEALMGSEELFGADEEGAGERRGLDRLPELRNLVHLLPTGGETEAPGDPSPWRGNGPPPR